MDRFKAAINVLSGPVPGNMFDGSGYLAGLKGSSIPFIAKIIAVADAFDAITTDRPYRGKKATDTAVAEISKYSGTQFDPQILSAFLRAHKKGNILL